MTKIRHCLLLLFLIVCLCIPAATELSADVRKLSVGILECAPICSIDPSKKNEAFLIEILTHIASREGWKVDFFSGTLSQNMDGLALGSIDLLAAVPYSPELASELHFTRETVISTWAQVYAHPNISVQSMLDLNSLTVGILRNDSYGKNMRSTVGGLNLDCTFLEFTQ